jgi:hypothetical protein
MVYEYPEERDLYDEMYDNLENGLMQTVPKITQINNL